MRKMKKIDVRKIRLPSSWPLCPAPVHFFYNRLVHHTHTQGIAEKSRGTRPPGWGREGNVHRRAHTKERRHARNTSGDTHTTAGDRVPSFGLPPVFLQHYRTYPRSERNCCRRVCVCRCNRPLQRCVYVCACVRAWRANVCGGGGDWSSPART